MLKCKYRYNTSTKFKEQIASMAIPKTIIQHNARELLKQDLNWLDDEGRAYLESLAK